VYDFHMSFAVAGPPSTVLHGTLNCQRSSVSQLPRHWINLLHFGGC